MKSHASDSLFQTIKMKIRKKKLMTSIQNQQKREENLYPESKIIMNKNGKVLIGQYNG